MMLELNYPEANDEVEIIRATTQTRTWPRKCGSRRRYSGSNSIRPRYPCRGSPTTNPVKLVRSTRPSDDAAPGFIRELSSTALDRALVNTSFLAAKARAALRRSPTVDLQDIASLAKPILRHRLILNFKARAQGQSVDTSSTNSWAHSDV